MACLHDKFSVDEIKAIDKRIHQIFNQATSISSATDKERLLLNSLEKLSRVSGMLCDMIQQEMEGHIETSDPHSYIDSKLSSSEYNLNSYVKKC